MDPLQEKFNQAKQSVSLSAERQANMRNKLAAYVTANPVATQSRWQFHFTRLTYVGTFAVVLVVVGASTAVAANGALPDSPLYMVKTHINEPVRAALIANEDDRAVYETQLAAKRVEEANQMAAQGKLDERTENKINKNLDHHVKRVENRAGRLRDDNKDDGNNNSDKAENQKRLDNAQVLLHEAREQMKKRDYGNAVEFGKRAVESTQGKVWEQVKGESTGGNDDKVRNEDNNRDRGEGERRDGRRRTDLQLQY